MIEGNPIIGLKDRTADNVLNGLQRNPRISMWDWDANEWLRLILIDLERDGRIRSADEPYPNYRWEVL